MTRVLVPSDITILEEKNKYAKRRLRLLERLGLMGMLPMLHLRYSKLDSNDKRDILRRKYDPMASSPVLTLLRMRQESVRKEVIAHNFVWAGMWSAVGMSWWSLRRYNYQSKLIVLPFMAYAGVWVGKVVGDLVTGRVWEQDRERILGSLPAKVYLDVGEGSD
jgi:dolichol kinase